MSYCRFSDDSDIYAYCGGSGFVIIIDHELSFHENTLIDFKNRLMKLRNQGYKIPDYVFEQIEKDLEESNVNTII